MVRVPKKYAYFAAIAVIGLLMVFAVPHARAALTFNPNSVVSDGTLNLTGVGSSTLDVGASTLSLQTSNNGPILTGSGLFTVGGSFQLLGVTSSIISTNASGTLGRLTVGSGLSLSANTLSATGGGSGITAINGLTNSTTSIAAGANVTITTSSPNVITIAATAASGTNPTINGITTSTFNFVSGSNLSVSTASPSTITYAFSNPGFVTAASSVTWTAAITHNATTTFAANTVFSNTTSSVLSTNASGTLGPVTIGSGLSYSGSTLSAMGGGSNITINGFTTSTFSFAAGSNVTITTSSPNVITIAASNSSSGAEQYLSGGSYSGWALSGNNYFYIEGVTTQSESQTSEINLQTTIGSSTINGIYCQISSAFASTSTVNTTFQVRKNGSNISDAVCTITAGNTTSSIAGLNDAVAPSDLVDMLVTCGSGSPCNATTEYPKFTVAAFNGNTILSSVASVATVTSSILATNSSGVIGPVTIGSGLSYSGSTLSASGGGGSIKIDGLTSSTFSIAAGSNITITTSSPNVITIAASGGGGGGGGSMITGNTDGDIDLSEDDSPYYIDINGSGIDQEGGGNILPFSATFSNLYITTDNSLGTGNSITVSLFDGSDSALTCTISGGFGLGNHTSCNDTDDTVSVDAGTQISFEIDTTGDPSDNAVYISAEITPN